MKHQDLIYDVTGQSLVWDCPEGRPSSVTDVSVFAMSTGDTGTAETATTGAASIDAVTTTVDAASGAGQTNPRIVYLASTADIAVGRPYALTSADGEREWIEPVAIDSGVSVTARHPLANAYTTGDTFQGVRISISIDDTWIQDESKLSDGSDPTPGYRVRWSYTASSIKYVHYNYLDVVRAPGGHSLLPTDIEGMYPNYRNRLPTYHRKDEGRKMLEEAYQDVRLELLANDVDDSSVRDVDAINRATLLRFGFLLERAHFAQGADTLRMEVALKDYDNFMNKIFRVSSRVRESTDTSGAGTMRVPGSIGQR